VHSDLEVVDENLRTLHPSFMRRIRLSPVVPRPLNTLLVQNFVTGCTILVNRSLLDHALPLPPEAVLHDWWLAVCAAAMGELIYVPQALVKYRQHAGNRVGATGPIAALLRLITQGRKRQQRHAANFLSGVAQARDLLQRLESIADRTDDEDTCELLRRYLSLFDANRSGLRRVIEARRLGIRRQSALKQMALDLQLLLGGSSTGGRGKFERQANQKPASLEKSRAVFRQRFPR